MLFHLDAATRALVRLAGAVAGGTETDVRGAVDACLTDAEATAVEEIILQSYLFAGFPRTLNAARIWRSVSGRAAPSEPVAGEGSLAEWRAQGERTCAIVYGDAYDRLRANVRALHPALDEWMIVDGYGKVLSRTGLDLRTRELAIVAACAAAGQQRQLHSHLHGALNAGASGEEIDATLRSLSGLVSEKLVANYRQLLKKVISARSDVH
jgi:4-carboxymuconolactone decarboxylase